MCTYVVVLAQIWDIESGDVGYDGAVQCLFFVEQIQPICVRVMALLAMKVFVLLLMKVVPSLVLEIWLL